MDTGQVFWLICGYCCEKVLFGPICSIWVCAKWVPKLWILSEKSKNFDTKSNPNQSKPNLSEWAKSEQAKSEQAKSEQLKCPQITASSMELFLLFLWFRAKHKWFSSRRRAFRWSGCCFFTDAFFVVWVTRHWRLVLLTEFSVLEKRVPNLCEWSTDCWPEFQVDHQPLEQQFVPVCVHPRNCRSPTKNNKVQKYLGGVSTGGWGTQRPISRPNWQSGNFFGCGSREGGWWWRWPRCCAAHGQIHTRAKP